MAKWTWSSSRRGFLKATATLAGLASATGAGLASPAEASMAKAARKTPLAHAAAKSEPFWGVHQGGIVTPAQGHTYFAAFDLVTTKPADVAKLFRAWTEAAARMTTGDTAQPLSGAFEPVLTTTAAPAGNYGPPDQAQSALGADTGEALGASPARLTVTFGFGAGLFVKDGTNRFGLAAKRPEALVDLPRFPGEQLQDARTGGDLSVQACAEDAQVAFHAVRQLARMADGIAQIRWVQTGFLPSAGAPGTPRNLMGFLDGTNNPPAADAAAMAKIIWVDNEGPDWMQGGSYMVTRRIRIAIEHWDRMTVDVQEKTVGRGKYSGAPLGQKHEHDPLDLAATDKDGNPIIPDNAHARLAAAETNDGARILRRPYSYNDGANFVAERWPPWRQGLEYDAGLFFICYQRDPRTGFIKINQRLSRFDMMNQFITHVGSGLFAVPRGPEKGEYIGQKLFETV